MQTNSPKLDLGGAWELQQVGKAAWIKATVPGNVHTDLIAAGKLQEDGLIHYKRGHISVLDRKGLEGRACECYANVKREYDRLLKPTQQ